MEMFDAILAANKPTGEIDGWQFGVVADNSDPLNFGRVQVYDQAKGGKYKSDWLFRALPFSSFTPPVPKVGDLVSFGYINGNPHHGCYSGVVCNTVNPMVGSPTDITVVLGGAKVVMDSQGNVKVTGAKDVTVEATTVKLKASQTLTLQASNIVLDTSNAKIAGKDIAAVGALDNGGDILINKGY